MLGALLWAADTTPTDSAGSNTPALVVIILAIIAVVPGCWAALVSSRTRKDMREKAAADALEGQGKVGVQFAQTAFKNLEAEVDALRRERTEWSRERDRWSQERERWHADRLKLLTRIEALNFQVLKLRQALQAAGLQVPEIPRFELDASA